jgi:hypothetical protein
MAGTRHARSGVYVSASWNLIDWSEPNLVWQVPTRAPKDGCAAATYDYPSLIDAASRDRNFATIGAAADLYLVRHHFENCTASPDRDLLRRHVRIAIAGGQP